jgi:predicted ATP-dependent endonuclease of OLD family
MLSTQSRTNKILERDLILIDEPDQSLYPTSAQHLKDELIEISKKSKIIFSTHSQYMIDSACLDRHIVVEKKDDITTLKKEDANAPYTDDELLRRAIGASIFECIKPKNIVFEGYLDKELFNKYCKSHKKEKEFKDFGQVYLSGILGAETLAQILILANKKFIIVADSDQTSKSKKADFEKNYPNHKKCWLGYDDVAKEIETMEDFFVIPHLESQIKESGYPDFVYDESKNAIKNIEKAVGNDKIKKQDVKNLVVKRLAKEHIKDEYGTFVSKLKETIDTL